MQDHYWSGLDEHWKEINCLECRGRTNQGMGAVNFISDQRQHNALYKGDRREYSLDSPLNTQILEVDQ